MDVDEIRGLRDSAVALRREWEEPRLHGRWEDAAVWFGSLLMLGPRATRGVGAFCSFVLISRTWAAAHRRHTRAVNDVLGRTVELVAEDLEDRAAIEDAVDELGAEVGRCRDTIGEIGEAVTGLEAGRGQAGAVADDVVAKDAVREYLDGVIAHWRGQRDRGDDAERAMAVHYVDAFQSARASLLGELLPLDAEIPFDGPGQRAYPYEDGDTLVIGPEAFVATPGEDVISWRGENYYRDAVPMRDGGLQFYIVRDVDSAERHVGQSTPADGIEVVPAHCDLPSGVARTVEQLRDLVAYGLESSPVGEVGIRPVQGPLLRPDTGKRPGVFLRDDEADALRAAVMGDHFDNAVMDRALGKVNPAHDRLLAAEADALGADPEDRAEAARVRADLDDSPQSDEELGQPRRIPSSGQGPAGSGPDR